MPLLQDHPFTRVIEIRRRLRWFHRDAQGAVAIEAAIATPFLVFLTAGIVEYGTLLYSMDLMQTGVRDAARYLASVPGLPAASGTDKAAMEARARRLAVTGQITTGGTARIRDWAADAAGVSIAYEANANPRDGVTGLRSYRGDDTVYVVRVTGTVNYKGIGLIRLLGVDTVPMNAIHEERHVAH